MALAMHLNGNQRVEINYGVLAEMTATHPAADRATTRDRDHALVIGGSSDKVTAIMQALKHHFRGVETATGLLPPGKGNGFGLIVVTDEIDPQPDRRFAKGLRQLFPHAKVVGIFDRFDAEVEIAMRCAGLVFWGSYERFNAHCDKILQTAVQQ